MEPQLSVSNLSIAFSDMSRTKTAVSKLNFTLRAGETLAIIGESGSGKSLTAYSILRLLPDNALISEKSHILFEEVDLFSLPEKEMRQYRGKKISMIFQEPQTALNPVLTIRQQLKESFNVLDNIKDDDLFEKLIEVELPGTKEFLNRYPHELSGGQKQRVVIAMALARKPDILVADEPTTALDVTIQAQILKLLESLQQKYQMAMIFITHDLNIAKQIATHILVMYAGMLFEYGKKDTLFSSFQHPYSKELLASIPSYEKRGQLLKTIPGKVPSIEKKPSGCPFHPRCLEAMKVCQSTIPTQHIINESIVACHLYDSSIQISEQEKLEHKFSSQNLLHNPHTVQNKQHSEVILSVDSVDVYYPKQTEPALKQISFNLNAQEVLALVGESGSGKTTIAKAILGLLPIHKGEILYQNLSISDRNKIAMKQYRQDVQMIFQDPYASLNPRWSVFDILSEGLVALGLNMKEIQNKIKESIDWMHLSSQSLDKYPHQFSGGQRQRIAIARALVLSPKVLICDEPTSALDVSVQAKILNLLKTIQQEREITYLFITHNFDVVSYIADRVIVMKDGSIIETGDTASILYHPKMEYTQTLTSSVMNYRIA